MSSTRLLAAPDVRGPARPAERIRKGARSTGQAVCVWASGCKPKGVCPEGGGGAAQGASSKGPTVL